MFQNWDRYCSQWRNVQRSNEVIEIENRRRTRNAGRGWKHMEERKPEEIVECLSRTYKNTLSKEEK